MRDIVFKKATPRQAPEEKPVASASSNKALVRFVEGIFETNSRLSSWLKSTLEPKEGPRILQQPALVVAAVSQAPSSKKRHRSIKITVEKLKNTAGTLARHTKHRASVVVYHVKTPLGKVMTIQTIAILGLFVYVGYNKFHNLPQLDPRSIGTTAQNAALRNYLPSAADYIQPKAFAEKSVANLASQNELSAWITPWNIPQQQDVSTLYHTVSAFWLTVQPNGSDLTTKADWSTWDAFRSAHGQDGQTFYLTVSGDPNFTSLALDNSSTQELLIKNLFQVVTDHNFNGIDIDFEALGSTNRDGFTSFMRNLTATFHNHNKLVSVAVEARIANQVPMDWHALSSIADKIIIMLYDYHARQTAFPGPIAPLGWMKETLDYATSIADPQKIEVALGNYGYDWTKQDDGSWNGEGISFDLALARAQNQGSISPDGTTPTTSIVRMTGIDERGYDIGSIPTYSYTDDQGHLHAVWFEDNASLQAKVNLVSQYHFPIRFWSVGLGDSAFWQNRLK